MKALNKRLKREFKTNMGRYGSIILLLIVVIALVSAFFTVGSSTKYTYNQTIKESNTEDGQFIANDQIDQEILSKLEEEYKITIYQDYYVDYVKDKVTYRIYNTRDEVNKAILYEGSLPTKDNEIALDRIYCNNADIEINDTITIDGKDYTVTGFIALSDYSSLFKTNTDLMMDTFTFTVGIMNDQGFQTLNQEHLNYKYSYIINQDNLSEKEERELLSDIANSLYQEGVALSSVLVSYDNQGLVFFIEDMGSDVPMMMVIYAIFIVIMAFVFSIIIRSTVESEASIIGTLLASGYSKYQLMVHYMILPIVVTLIGVLIGNICANTFMITIFKNLYYSSYSLAPMIFHINYGMTLFTSLLPIALILLINVSYLLKVLGITPLKFLRKDIKKHKKRKYIKLPNFRFISRFRIRVILQNKGSYIVLFFGIFFASFLLMFSLAMQPIFSNFVDQIQDSSIPNYQYILKTPIEIEDEEKFNVTSLEFVNYYSKNNMETTIYGIENDSEYYQDIDTTKQGIYVSEGVLKKANKKVGDTIIFYHSYLDEEYEFEILGVCDYPSSLVVFMSREYFNEVFDKDADYFTGYLSNNKLDINDVYVSKTITKEDISAAGEQAINTFSEMIPILMAASILVYVVVMYILSKVVIDKNALNMSYLKIFGYTNQEVRKVYLTSTLIIVILSLLLSLPIINIGMYYAFELAFMTMNSYVSISIPSYLYLEIVIIGFISYFVINLIHVRKVNKVDMMDALKDRE